MTAVLTVDQADLLAAYGWQATDLLLGGDEAISHAKGSVSCAVAEPWSWRTVTRGIVGRRGRHAMVVDEPADGDVVVTWSQVRAAAKAVPDDLAAELRRACRRTRREWARHFPEHRGWAPGGQAAWVAPPPAWHRDAQAAQQRITRDVLAVLSGRPAVRTSIGPRPGSIDTWLRSHCLTCGWRVEHLEERGAMEHTIEVREHQCGDGVREPEQLDLFGAAA